MIKAIAVYQPFASFIVRGRLSQIIIDRKETYRGPIMVAGINSECNWKDKVTNKGLEFFERLDMNMRLSGMHPKDLYPVGKFIGAVEILDIVREVDNIIWAGAKMIHSTVYLGKFLRFRVPVLANTECGFYNAKISKQIMDPDDYERFQEMFKDYAPQEDRPVQLAKALNTRQKRVYKSKLKKRKKRVLVEKKRVLKEKKE
jgi:hypothetical protein